MLEAAEVDDKRLEVISTDAGLGAWTIPGALIVQPEMTHRV